MKFDIVILAAGKGKRMHSAIPKALHKIGGVSFLDHISQTLLSVNFPAPIIVYNPQEKLPELLPHLNAVWVPQKNQLGTGHALQQALSYLKEEYVLVLNGDIPLISGNSLLKLINTTAATGLGLITVTINTSNNAGVIVRNENQEILRIVERADATLLQQNIKEINSGIYLIPTYYLKKWLPLLKNNNKQQEYYLTDVIALAADENIPIQSVQPDFWQEVQGVNDHQDLANLERYFQLQQAIRLMQQGVTFSDPTRFDLRGSLTIGQDSIFDVNVIIEGKVEIGNNCKIGANTLLKNTIIHDDVEILSNCVIEGAELLDRCVIGPFARIRPDTALATDVKIGNFVEVKNSNINSKTKINHLSYIGDSKIGKEVNIGAGTITCNFDGANKHITTIKDGAFIGSNCQLIAPIVIGEFSTIGAGSTINKDTPPFKLTLARSPQITIENWQRPLKRNEKDA